MSAAFGWSKLCKMWPNRLICASIVSKIPTRRISTSQIPFPVRGTTYVTYTLGGYRFDNPRMASPWSSRCTSAVCGMSNQNVASLSLQLMNVPSHQTVRGLSTSGTSCGIFSNRSSSDALHPNENLIYSGPLTNMVKMVKLFSLSTSGLSIIILQIMFMGSGSGAMKLIGGSMASLLLLTPIVLHWLTKSYATQIYYDNVTDTYTAYTLNFFLTTSKREFTPADVEVPAVRNLMTSFMIKGKPLLVNPTAFFHPNHFSHLMGYDKLPNDFSMEEMEKAMAEDSDDEYKKK